jgi:hypothetical protein
VDVGLEQLGKQSSVTEPFCSPCTAIVEILVFARIFIFVAVLKKVTGITELLTKTNLVAAQPAC